MSGKIIKHGLGTQAEIIEGVEKTVEAIKTTMGPSGKHVAVVTGFGTEVTRDGATVAKSINFSDPALNIGAELVRKASVLTEESVGDSTSSTALLISEFCKKGQRAVSSGANVNEIKSGMLKARDWVKEFIVSSSTAIDGDLDSIKNVATISANNDPSVGQLVVDCMKEVGIDGVITADLSGGLETRTELTTGLKIERGWVSPQYITSPDDGTCILNNPLIVVAGESISSMNQIIDMIGKVMEQKRELLIICDEITENVNATLVYNTLQGAIRCCVVRGIDFGDGRKNIMNDVAVTVGAQYLGQDNGRFLKDAGLGDLGTAKKVVISRESCIIYEGAGDKDKINSIADILRKRVNDPNTSEYDKMKFSKRLAGLVGGIAVIYAGGATEAEKMNLKATIEDSILAAKSAISEGYVPGGGYVFVKASEAVNKDKAFWKSLTGDEIEGAKVVFSGITCIARTIAENSGGESPDIVLNVIKNTKDSKLWGYNAKTKEFGNLVDEGVLDSAKALRVSLENSISTASMILLVDCMVYDEPETPTLDQ